MKAFFTFILITIMFMLWVDSSHANSQYNFTRYEVARYINHNSGWKWSDKKQQLYFCVGIDNINNIVQCFPVPKEYVVIKYITPPE